jgi:small-conductance mechanosensitive channel
MARRRLDPVTKLRLREWLLGITAGAVALAALIIGSELGKFHTDSLHDKVIAWIAAVVVLVAGVIATRQLSAAAGSLISQRSIPAAGSAVRLLATGVGYVVVAFSVFAVLGVSIAHLLLGVGLAGVVLGIAAQQSLGNIFASLVLLFSKPFVVGDYIRIRSGVVGVIDVWVDEIGLTYVTVRSEDGLLKIPNSAMLAAGIGQLQPPPHGAAGAG